MAGITRIEPHGLFGQLQYERLNFLVGHFGLRHFGPPSAGYRERQIVD
jgi:hypothetical protein